MTSIANAGSRSELPFNYHSLRNISGPEDTREDRRVFSGYALFSSFLNLDEDENVRGYLVTAQESSDNAFQTYIVKCGIRSLTAPISLGF